MKVLFRVRVRLIRTTCIVSFTSTRDENYQAIFKFNDLELNKLKIRIFRSDLN